MSKSKLIIKILAHLLRVLPFIIIVLIGIPIVGMANIEISKLLGLKAIPVSVAGTGSMYPSLFWSVSEGGPEDETKKVIEEYRSTPHLYRRYDGLTIFGHTFLRSQISFGDMVAFKSDKTVEILKKEEKDIATGFIKRVIGMPGDTIELRDGFVYKNDSLISESYTNAPRSTYGGSGLKDCTKVTVPPGKYFVLGDNRKVSSDSRYELGFVEEKDILFYLPYSKQNLYQSFWRNPEKDNLLMGRPTLSADEFVNLVNEARNSRGIKNLKLNSSLLKSAATRGEHLLIDPKTNFDMQQAMEAAHYSNVILGEFVSYGHFSAKELLENLLFNGATAKQILNKDISDIGVANISREISGCPTQIIVGHLGGYIPAAYEQTTIDRWRELRDNLRVILSSWESARGYNSINQEKLEVLMTVLRRRLSLAEEILTVMERREWLSNNQQQRIKDDDKDAKASEIISKELNKE